VGVVSQGGRNAGWLRISPPPQPKGSMTTPTDLSFLRSQTRSPVEEDARRLRVVDLFCGCGGMSLGLEEAARRRGLRLQLRLAMDLNDEAATIFDANFSPAEVRRDPVEAAFDGALGAELTPVEQETRAQVGEELHVLMGGPPCQGHSDLNNHTRRDDPRNALYLRMARAAEVLSPRCVLIENVRSVIHASTDVVGVTVKRLSELGYAVHHEVLNLHDLGVPQTRHRHILLALRDGDPAAVVSASRSGPYEGRTVWWAIGDLELTDSSTGFDTASKSSDLNKQRMRWLFENGAHELVNSERPDCHKDGNHSYRAVYGRLYKSKPANTITTGFGSMGQGRYVHPTKQRVITPHEAARLQTFPDFFNFEAVSKRGAWSRAIGNAVPPLLTLRLGEALIDAMGEDKLD